VAGSKGDHARPVRPVVVSFPRAGLLASGSQRPRPDATSDSMVYVRYEEPRIEMLPTDEYGK
jgi:hypothetical protein